MNPGLKPARYFVWVAALTLLLGGGCMGFVRTKASDPIVQKSVKTDKSRGVVSTEDSQWQIILMVPYFGFRTGDGRSINEMVQELASTYGCKSMTNIEVRRSYRWYVFALEQKTRVVAWCAGGHPPAPSNRTKSAPRPAEESDEED